MPVSTLRRVTLRSLLAVWLGMTPGCILIDLPLCLAADTLLLPLTVYQQITYTPPAKPPGESAADEDGS